MRADAALHAAKSACRSAPDSSNLLAPDPDSWFTNNAAHPGASLSARKKIPTASSHLPSKPAFRSQPCASQGNGLELQVVELGGYSTSMKPAPVRCQDRVRVSLCFPDAPALLQAIRLAAAAGASIQSSNKERAMNLEQENLS